MIFNGKQLDEGERPTLMRTIEGDIEPDSHDYVSNLKPRSLAVAENARSAAMLCTDSQAALKARLLQNADTIEELVGTLDDYVPCFLRRQAD